MGEYYPQQRFINQPQDGTGSRTEGNLPIGPFTANGTFSIASAGQSITLSTISICKPSDATGSTWQVEDAAGNVVMSGTMDYIGSFEPVFIHNAIPTSSLPINPSTFTPTPISGMTLVLAGGTNFIIYIGVK